MHVLPCVLAQAPHTDPWVRVPVSLCLQAFLSILCAMKWGTFLFFAGWVLIMTIFVILCVPETKVRLL
jgi:hypothetical protein